MSKMSKMSREFGEESRRASCTRLQHGVHEQVQVRQQRREPRGQREAQLEEQLAHGGLVRGGVRADERVEQRGEQRQELLVELLELAAADGLEERTEQREVVGRVRQAGSVPARSGSECAALWALHLFVQIKRFTSTL